MFILVSSNSENKEKGIFSKSVDYLESELGCQLKVPALDLSTDVIHLTQICQKKYQLKPTICESSLHKKNLLSRQCIMNQIFQFFSRQQNFLQFYYTGHGFREGDLCIQTIENPDGQRVKIQDILETYLIATRKVNEIKRVKRYLNLYIDACYSGNNALRARQYLKKQQKNYDFLSRYQINLESSSGPQQTSVNNCSFGSLLIGRQWLTWCYKNKQLQKELYGKYIKREPYKMQFLQIRNKIGCQCGGCYMTFRDAWANKIKPQTIQKQLKCIQPRYKKQIYSVSSKYMKALSLDYLQNQKYIFKENMWNYQNLKQIAQSFCKGVIKNKILIIPQEKKHPYLQFHDGDIIIAFNKRWRKYLLHQDVRGFISYMHYLDVQNNSYGQLLSKIFCTFIKQIIIFA